ncbi:MAG: amidohydrolase family protein [Planctomycetota bacterium]|nr:amidohydrolase family protein [Planctomycetota bacterium]
MTQRADAHIHLFSGGYQDSSFASRSGVVIDEAACYHSLAADCDVTAALVVGFGGEDWCVDNNRYLAEQVGRYEWIRPVAYVTLDSPFTVDELQQLQQQGFVGISLFCFDDEFAGLAAVPDTCWRWIVQRNWLVSVNSQAAGWSCWGNVLERFPDLRLLVSHLGLPPALAQPPAASEAALALQSVTELAQYPGVYVKLSGFYALTVPGHDYPHRAAWPYVKRLYEAFGSERLLWASDFSPCLDWVTFPQTFDLFQKMSFLSTSDVGAITGGNLRKLLEEI